MPGAPVGVRGVAFSSRAACSVISRCVIGCAGSAGGMRQGDRGRGGLKPALRPPYARPTPALRLPGGGPAPVLRRWCAGDGPVPQPGERWSGGAVSGGARFPVARRLIPACYNRTLIRTDHGGERCHSAPLLSSIHFQFGSIHETSLHIRTCACPDLGRGAGHDLLCSGRSGKQCDDHLFGPRPGLCAGHRRRVLRRGHGDPEQRGGGRRRSGGTGGCGRGAAPPAIWRSAALPSRVRRISWNVSLAASSAGVRLPRC